MKLDEAQRTLEEGQAKMPECEDKLARLKMKHRLD
jgi:hypothetical protein